MPPKKFGKKTTKTNKASKVKRNPLFEKKPRSFRIGGNIQPKRDLTRFVRWPKYIILQRQKRILLQRLKVPPALNQFSSTIDRNQATTLLKLLRRYAPESRQKKKERRLEAAKAKAENKQPTDTKPPIAVKYGLNTVTGLIEDKKARLVIIANDVDPIETIVWLPQLCRRQDVPFCFIRGKARLGKLIGKKTASCVALTGIRKEDQAEFDNLVKTFKAQFNENVSLRREWGGGILGHKSRLAEEAKRKAIEAEQLKKAAL
jgi:large subunit ribosomal protein L7Ae